MLKRKSVNEKLTLLMLISILTLLVSLNVSKPILFTFGKEDEPVVRKVLTSRSSLDTLGLFSNSLAISRFNSDRSEFEGSKDFEGLYELPQEDDMEISDEVTYTIEVTPASVILTTNDNQIKISKAFRQPKYDAAGKLVISSMNEAYELDIRTPSNWEREDFIAIVNEELYPLVGKAIKMEKLTGINAVYLVAVGCIETDYGRQLVGDYNYFNWSTDGVYHYDFENIDEFYKYSMYKYMSNYTKNDFYNTYEGLVGEYPEVINIKVVNTAYAHYGNNRINWKWSEVLGEVMATLSDKRLSLTSDEIEAVTEAIYNYESEYGFQPDTLEEDTIWLKMKLAGLSEVEMDDLVELEEVNWVDLDLDEIRKIAINKLDSQDEDDTNGEVEDADEGGADEEIGEAEGVNDLVQNFPGKPTTSEPEVTQSDSI